MNTPNPTPAADMAVEAVAQKIFEHLQGWGGATFGWQDNIPGDYERAKQAHADECIRRIKIELAALARPQEVAGVTEELHVGESDFETWYSIQSPEYGEPKQLARDAYAAGMEDPLVMPRAPVAVGVEPVLPPMRRISGVDVDVLRRAALASAGAGGSVGAEPAELPNITKTAPKRIWLVIGEDAPAEANFTECSEVTWCEDQIDTNSIAYVRADLATPAPSVPLGGGEERDALIERVDAMLGDVYHCTRAWSAWQVGTMSEHDFTEARGSSLAAEIVDEILANAALQAQDAAPVERRWTEYTPAGHGISVVDGGPLDSIPAAGVQGDAARLDWLIENGRIGFELEDGEAIATIAFETPADTLNDLRVAIDAARAQASDKGA
jgi:hypothetical protein